MPGRDRASLAVKTCRSSSWMERNGQSLQGQTQAGRGRGGRGRTLTIRVACPTEFIGGLGFDGVFIDCEHGVASVERVQEMCRAARAAGVQSIVRPETDAPYLLARYLDAGAGGIIVPHVETAAAVDRIVETVRYARPNDHEDKVSSS